MEPQTLAKLLGATPLFSDLPRRTLTQLIEESQRQQASASAWLPVGEGGLVKHIVLLAGELQAQRAWLGSDGEEHQSTWRVGLRPDGPGFSLLSAASSRIRVQALTDVDYFAIDGDRLDEMLGWTHLDETLVLVKHLKIFQKVPMQNALQALARMTERQVQHGETVVTQGEPGDAYHIIVEGEAEVWVTDPLSDETTCVTVLREGEAFGEEALLLDGNRTATVKMISPGRLRSLCKDDFDALLKPAMVGEIDAERANALLTRGDALLLDCRYEMEFGESRIPGAQLVPLDRLRREAVFAIDPQATYVVYCRSGRRSMAAAFLLRERGIRALSLEGGIRDWPYAVDNTPH